APGLKALRRSVKRSSRSFQSCADATAGTRAASAAARAAQRSGVRGTRGRAWVMWGTFALLGERAVSVAPRWPKRERAPRAWTRCGAVGYRSGWRAPMLAEGRAATGIHMVFRISLLLAVALAVAAGLAPQRFGLLSTGALAAVVEHVGWLSLLVVRSEER